MNQDEIKKLKEVIQSEINLIESELNEFASKNPQIKDDYKTHFHKADPSDTLDEKAHSITDYEGERAVEQNLELRLKELKETLKKVDEGTYGTCDRCQEPIDTKRLKVVPSARFCLDCAKRATLI